MWDYDTQELLTKNPQLYLQKWVDYGFRMGQKMKKDLYLKYRKQVTIEPLLDEYLQLIINHDPQ
jgi:hypothetical protein